LDPARFALCTLHRPSNVDAAGSLQRMLDVLVVLCGRLPVVFPLHPRTEMQLRRHQCYEALEQIPGVILTRALGYAALIGLLRKSAFVLTDSGGIQEESTALGVPCLSFRSTTERPATLAYGTNTLIANRDAGTVLEQMELILSGQYRSGRVPPFWDGHAAERIAAVLTQTEKVL
ncbi:MAG: UDP-N-acetylglucosamine 2-epimerase, partial [Saprospiraceae bacterium]|nr:UDP-N-acetylglucosamine 2-epimerase [Saprospiraceae bacterium]